MTIVTVTIVIGGCHDKSDVVVTTVRMRSVTTTVVTISTMIAA